MAIGVLKNGTVVAPMPEVTEGVPVLPSVGSDFIQILEGITIEPAKELVEREILTPDKGKVQPRATTRSVTGALPVEWKGSGTEGLAPETGILYESLLGEEVATDARLTTGTGHTTNTLNVVAHGLTVGEMFVILEAGSHHTAFVKTVVGVDDIEFYPSATFTPTNGVEISVGTTYRPGGTEPTYTLNAYWGDEILEQAIGARSSAMSIENITTGQLPTASFSYEGLDFERADASSGIVTVFDDELPPISLNVNVAVDDVCLDMETLSLSIENTISQLTSVKSESGRINSRVSERSVTGSMTPYLDDTDLTLFENFKNNTSVEFAVTMGNPSGVTGEFDLGSVVGFYCPNTLFTTFTNGDQDGTLINSIEFNANTGATGSDKEVFIGFV